MTEYTINTKKANIIGLIIALPLIAVMTLFFWCIWEDLPLAGVRALKKTLAFTGNDMTDTIATILAPVAIITLGTILHECVHGIAMFVFTKNLNSIKIGFRPEALLPYAQCKQPLTVFQMLIVSLSPWLLLGLIPFLISLVSSNAVHWFIGVSMTLVSVGDFLYSWLLIKIREKYLVLDHDTKIGFYVIENHTQN